MTSINSSDRFQMSDENKQGINKGISADNSKYVFNILSVIKILFIIVITFFVFFFDNKLKISFDTNNQDDIVPTSLKNVKPTSMFIPFESQAGGYFAKSLNINIGLGTDMSGDEYRDKIIVRQWGKKGEIFITRDKTSYKSLEEMENKLTDEKLIKALKSDFFTYHDVKGRIYDIDGNSEKIYFLYFDKYIYALKTTDPELYQGLSHVARYFYYGDPYEEARSRPTSTPVPHFSLIRNNSNSDIQEIFKFDINSDIVRWRDKLLFTYNYGERLDDSNILSVYFHDLKNGVTKTIFKRESDFLIMSNLNIIGDTLYLSLGDFLRDGESYWIDLNTEDKSAYALWDKSGHISNIKGRYFFRHGTGDACWGKSSFALIDINSKKVTPLVDTAVGCIPGDEDLVITESKMILATRGNEDRNMLGDIYTSIYAIDLDNPSNKNTLLSYDQMPKNITYVKYFEHINSLIFLGNSVYQYNLSNNTLSQIVDLPNELIRPKNFDAYNSTPIVSSYSDSILCIYNNHSSIGGVHKLLINLMNKSYSYDVSGCPPEEVEQGYKEKTPQEIFDSLQLPNNYRLVQK